jgi:hypothetical protein
MMRYDIEETAVYIQVRTVVWEDGAARPLLPDSRRAELAQGDASGARPACPYLSS